MRIIARLVILASMFSMGIPRVVSLGFPKDLGVGGASERWWSGLLYAFMML